MKDEPLTDEQIRSKVAELMLGKPTRTQEAEWLYWLMPNGHWIKVPDYTVDLNACAEMEKTLTGKDRDEYVGFLCDVIDKPEFAGESAAWGIAHATARQRAIAFLLTKGVIKEEKV